MASETETITDRGVGGSLNWLVGGAVGGVAGAVIFGALLWILEPTAVTETIPGMYGLDGGGMAGWAFHLLHGVLLGIIFAFVVTREFVLGILTADVETPILDSLSLTGRFTGAGLAYGIAVWAFGPGLILATAATIGDTVNLLPVGSGYNLLGHLLYGSLLGAMVSVFTDVEAEAHESEAPFEEEPGGSSGGRQ